MVCPFCQAELSATDKTCPMCGAPINETPTQKPETQINYDIPMAIEDPGKKMGLVGMIMGIASLVLAMFSCCCCTYASVVLLIAAVAGLVLSIIAMNKSKKVGLKNTQALVGLITSGAAILLSLVTLIYIIVMFSLYGFAALSGSMFGG